MTWAHSRDREYSPLVSFIMAVHNGEAYIRESLCSVLGQEYPNLEVVLVDDGSTDQTPSVISSFDDPRLTVITLQERRGLAHSLNIAMTQAHGDYLARMDADDICVPERLRLQVDFMNSAHDVGVLGGSMIAFGSNGNREYVLVKASCDLLPELMSGNPLKHPTVMLRKEVLEHAGLRYDEKLPNAQDYDLWSRLARVTKLANIPNVLVYYRVHGQQQTSLHRNRQRRLSLRIQLGLLANGQLRRQAGSLAVIVGFLAWLRHGIAWMVHGTLENVFERGSR